MYVVCCVAEISHFEVVVQEVSESGVGPAVALATCSPLFPSSPCTLLNDFIRFFPNGHSQCTLCVLSLFGYPRLLFSNAANQTTEQLR